MMEDINEKLNGCAKIENCKPVFLAGYIIPI
jgi:hypothetical protein